MELVSPTADPPMGAGKHEMALCDLGITEANYLLPETGTIVLHSSAEMPCAVSLLPRIHLAIVRSEMLRLDMRQVFAEAKDSNYLVFITDPGRTADIELTTTLGVHGPIFYTYRKTTSATMPAKEFWDLNVTNMIK